MSDPDASSGSAIGKALCAGTATLRKAGIDQPRHEARLLLEAASGLSPAAQLSDRHAALGDAAAQRFHSLIARRVAQEPVSRILGRREFWSLGFTVTPDTLDPRPDTETVVEAVLAAKPDRAAPLRILDLGTGTGCIVLALLHEYRNALGVAVDRSPAAIAVAQGNAVALGLADRFLPLAGDWAGALAGAFDVIVSNPPYIPGGEIGGLAPEVRCHDPRGALDGGADGLDAYRALASCVTRYLVPDGVIALEVGAGQAVAVAALLSAAHLGIRDVRADLAGIPRCVVAGPQPGWKSRKKAWRGGAH